MLLRLPQISTKIPFLVALEDSIIQSASLTNLVVDTPPKKKSTDSSCFIFIYYIHFFAKTFQETN